MVGEKEVDELADLFTKKKDEVVKLLKESSNQRQILAALELATKKKKTPANKTPASSLSRTKQITEANKTSAKKTIRTPKSKENTAPSQISTETKKTRPVQYDSSKYMQPSKPITRRSVRPNQTIVVETQVVKHINADETRIIETNKAVTQTIVEDMQEETKLPPIPSVGKEDARTERRRSKSCSHVALNRTQILRGAGGCNETGAGRRSRGNMGDIKEVVDGEKSPRSQNQQASGGKPRTPCFERLYKQRHRSVIFNRFFFLILRYLKNEFISLRGVKGVRG